MYKNGIIQYVVHIWCFSLLQYPWVPTQLFRETFGHIAVTDGKLLGHIYPWLVHIYTAGWAEITWNWQNVTNMIQTPDWECNISLVLSLIRMNTWYMFCILSITIISLQRWKSPAARWMLARLPKQTFPGQGQSSVLQENTNGKDLCLPLCIFN